MAWVQMSLVVEIISCHNNPALRKWLFVDASLKLGLIVKSHFSLPPTGGGGAKVI
jgi:hypothetical protein